MGKVENILSKISMLQATNPNWKLSKPVLPSYKEYAKTRVPSEFQSEALRVLSGSRFSGMVAPCGSGKGTFQNISAIQDVVESGFTRPQVIHAPQLHIGLSFVRSQAYLIEGDVHEHVIGDNENFVGGISFESKADTLERWLCSTINQKRGGCKDRESLRGMIVVCSNTLLVSVFDRMEARTHKGSSEDRKKATHQLHNILRNTTFRPDESQHLKNTGNKDALVETNGLSRFYSFLYNSHVKSSKVVFTTATPFRGDCQEIFTKELLDEFKVYQYSWLRHWRTLGIHSFSMNYSEFKKDPVQQILDAVAEEPQRYPLVLVPRRGEAWRKGVKGEKLVRKLIRGLEKLKPRRVCDLVVRVGRSQAERDVNKQKLLEDNNRLQQGEKHLFDIVVACDVVREGTDWVICDRIHESAPKASITMNIQTMGRMFRKFHKKANVVYCAYIPLFILPRGYTSRSELLNDRTRILLFFLVVDSMTYPCELPSLKRASKDQNYEGNRFVLEDLYKPVPVAYHALMAEVIEGFRCSKRAEGVSELEHAENVIQAALNKYSTPDEHMDFATAHFKRILINLFGARKIRTPNYKELSEYLRKFGSVLFKGACSSKHYGNFVDSQLERFYEICTNRRDAFYAEKRLRPLNVP